ncbi:ankyrin repeat domain-containing protein [Flavobacterium facile]|uniref:ankyrin repeat domain-containing protein n=1 Tax=Flavobacterium facile TaxID=2893174 RepID=UPI002E78399C|nr:ankyrin repeat domain-containing protein [Flavobacterium sp. T-12]
MRLLVVCFFITNLVFSQKDVFSIARNGSVNEIKILFEKNPNCVNEVDKNGFSPLILASYRGNFEVAKYLTTIVKDVNYQSPEGTAVMAAVMRNNTELIQLLIDKKANLDATSRTGVTALMLAIQFKNIEVIKLLLQHNADKLLKDKEGRTAFEYAVNTKNDAIIQLLKN